MVDLYNGIDHLDITMAIVYFGYLQHDNSSSYHFRARCWTRALPSMMLLGNFSFNAHCHYQNARSNAHYFIILAPILEWSQFFCSYGQNPITTSTVVIKIICTVKF